MYRYRKKRYMRGKLSQQAGIVTEEFTIRQENFKILRKRMVQVNFKNTNKEGRQENE